MNRSAGVFGMAVAAAVLALFATPALANKAPRLGKHPIGWYRLNEIRNDCVDRSFSVSVGNPAFPNRLAIWPGPCRR
jgi:hypothetical protein